MKKSKSNSIFYIIIVLIIIIYPATYYGFSETIEITVTDKERITSGSGEDISSKFIVYGEDEVFENTDSWLYFKFNSTDYQGKLHVNNTYKVKVAGFRVPFFSWYRNIVKIY